MPTSHSSKQQMQHIAISAPALTLLLRVGLSCLAQPRNLATRFVLLFSISSPTLFDLLSVIPSIAVDLLKYCNETSPIQMIIEENDVLILLSRYDHLAPSIGYLSNPLAMITLENKMYSERLQELGIDLSIPANQAVFLFGDLLTFGKINRLSANRRLAEEVISETEPSTTLQNVTIPNDLRHGAILGTWVGVHFGVIVFVGKTKKHETLFNLLLAQQIKSLAGNSSLRDLPQQIDYRNFCPSKTKHGANLVEWSKPLITSE